MYIYIYTHTYTYILHKSSFGVGVCCVCCLLIYVFFSPKSEASPCEDRRRENMVGVNMVLAESVEFKHGLYQSCGIEWLRVLC